MTYCQPLNRIQHGVRRASWFAMVMLFALPMGCTKTPVGATPQVSDGAVAAKPEQGDNSAVNDASANEAAEELAANSPARETDASVPAAGDHTPQLESDPTTQAANSNEQAVATDTMAADTTAAPETKLAPAERILLLTRSGPLLIDLHITIDGMPYHENFDTVLSDVLKIADDDGDGRVTWKELMEHPRFREGQFGNPATATYQAQQEMTRLYDTTKNGRVDADELVRYLSSNQSTAQPMALYTSNYRREDSRDKSPIREWLDVNDDLVLDADEIAGAARRLRLRDTNDDEILSPMDFVDGNGMNMGMQSRRQQSGRTPRPNAGWHIRENESWNVLLYGWKSLYSLEQDVRIDDLVIGRDLFEQLNIDGDEILSAFEMEMLRSVEPHISVKVELGGYAPDDSSADDTNADNAADNVANYAETSPRLELTALRLLPEHTEGVVQHQPNRITIELPDTTLDIFANDIYGSARFQQQAKQYVKQADADDNSYLSEDEFGAVQQFVNMQFDSVDLDDNDMVIEAEIVSVLKQRDIVRRAQIRVKCDDQDDALLPSVDVNSDGRIDSREIAEVADSLLALDANEDGQVQLHELRNSMVVGVVRGGGNNAIMAGDQTFQIPAVVRRPSESSPRWFISMDRNRDGGITWREFLGTREQFQNLDENSDGFLNAEEAVQPRS